MCVWVGKKGFAESGLTGDVFCSSGLFGRRLGSLFPELILFGQPGLQLPI
jgi:hypothetical protein